MSTKRSVCYQTRDLIENTVPTRSYLQTPAKYAANSLEHRITIICGAFVKTRGGMGTSISTRFLTEYGANLSKASSLDQNVFRCFSVGNMANADLFALRSKKL